MGFDCGDGGSSDGCGDDSGGDCGNGGGSDGCGDGSGGDGVDDI